MGTEKSENFISGGTLGIYLQQRGEMNQMTLKRLLREEEELSAIREGNGKRMMVIRSILLIYAAVVVSATEETDIHWGHCSEFDCPSDPAFGECQNKLQPPFPICCKKTVAEWIESAKDSATRCCGGDLTDCQCPVKDKPKFLNKIPDYCSAVAACSTANLRGNNLAMGEQIQREEYVEWRRVM